MDTFKKQSDTVLRVTKAPSAPEVKTYDISFLKTQREQIVLDQERVAKELAEVDALIEQAGILGIVEKTDAIVEKVEPPVDIVPVEEVVPVTP